MKNKLTVKQEKYAQGLFMGMTILKMEALKEMGKLLGMFGKTRGKKTIGNPHKIMLIAYLYFEAKNYIQKYALAALLDYYMPVWREIVGIENLGGIVKRNSKEVREWTKEVLKQYGNECAYCGSKENVQAHHIIHWSELEEARTVISNGIALCVECHAKQHKKLSSFIVSRIYEGVA